MFGGGNVVNQGVKLVAALIAAVLFIGIITHAQGFATVFNSIAGFFEKGFSAELGYPSSPVGTINAVNHAKAH